MFSSQYSGLAVNAGETELKGAIIENIVYGDTLSTDIKIFQTKSTPTDFFLSQNYPNPFNSTTSIEYKIPFTSEVEISIYNILGKKIKILTNGKKEEGIHKVILNGEKLTSGVYIYEFKSKNIIKSKKCFYVKSCIPHPVV